MAALSGKVRRRRRSRTCSTTRCRAGIRRRPPRRRRFWRHRQDAEELLYQGREPCAAGRGPAASRPAAASGGVPRRSCGCEPTKAFPGASYVPRGAGVLRRPSGLAAGCWSPARTRSRRATWPGMLAEAGLRDRHGHQRPRVVPPGDHVARLRVGADRPRIDQPTVDLLLQQLRRDYRTADLRVGLIARAGCSSWPTAWPSGDPMTMAFAAPARRRGVPWQLGQLATIVAAGVRRARGTAEQAATALDLLAELSGGEASSTICADPGRGAGGPVYARARALKAIDVLANLGIAPRASGRWSIWPAAHAAAGVRQAAAKAFVENVKNTASC